MKKYEICEFGRLLDVLLSPGLGASVAVFGEDSRIRAVDEGKN
jgi:hypothetical protein